MECHQGPTSSSRASFSAEATTSGDVLLKAKASCEEEDIELTSRQQDSGPVPVPEDYAKTVDNDRLVLHDDLGQPQSEVCKEDAASTDQVEAQLLISHGDDLEAKGLQSIANEEGEGRGTGVIPEESNQPVRH